jgi:hypothetical protein
MQKELADIIRESNDEEEPKNKVLPFRVITGGKDPTDPTWLTGYGVGTIFVCKKKGDPLAWPGFEYGISRVSDSGKTYILLDTQGQHIPVIPDRFCRVFDLHEILQTQEEFIATKFEVTNDGPSNRTDKPVGLADPEDVA